ncbi:branched-chain amino acid aminotransferase [Arcanobacterium hippocoleae]|uniref:branched-chain-amino-acid transaminase n=1 Tax=Arcanobacterium hippocoleae TaxID=149017 RepID=A0ABU1T1D3_9ACTO|nr:branched-chain amino acid aminotransferase [Arcanobacterium hippocoleae]MDR6939187.1 branched-chain amino acid aminotransferase [Arcanobacterium hippocoleae]
MVRHLTELEKLAGAPLPAASEIADIFRRDDTAKLKSAAEYERIMRDLAFGVDFTDHMARAVWTVEEGWAQKEITQYAPLSLDPAAAVLHYGQEVFEGIKAYRHADGSVWTFRPAYNAARLNMSNRRLAIPELPVEDFLASLVGLIRADQKWVPEGAGASLYLRPFIIATEAFLGVRAAKRYDYLVIASPSGPYFKNGFEPINVWVDREYHRAGPGGMGNVKTGGNYAASLLPKVVAHENGYDEVLFMDAATNTYLDELGGMNVFVVKADGSVATPELTGNILPGGTRASIIELLTDIGVEVREERIALTQLLAQISAGEVVEMFACGTAAVVTPIGSLTGTDFSVEVPSGELTRRIHDEITAIQTGKQPDRFGWLYQLAGSDR